MAIMMMPAMMHVCEKEVCLSCAGCEVERRESGEERRVVRLRELSENSRTIRERDKEVSFRGVSASFPGISRVSRHLNFVP